MELKFPLARLYLLYQLHGQRRSCARALVDTAYETGILPEGVLDFWIEENGELQGSCGAMLTARRIAEEKLAQIHGGDKEKIKELTESIISQVGIEVESYNRKNKKNKELDENSCIESEDQSDCGNMAPIILDFLIQQLGRY